MSQASVVKCIGYTQEDPLTLSDGRVVPVRSSSRLAMLLVAVLVVGTWSTVNIVNVCRVKPAADGSWAPVAVADFPWIAALLVVAVMFAKDKPLDRLAEIAAALKR
jgi:hypothetical protein